ncbi:hypothetical protein ES703_105806 [subsurface metagenome]
MPPANVVSVRVGIIVVDRGVDSHAFHQGVVELKGIVVALGYLTQVLQAAPGISCESAGSFMGIQGQRNGDDVPPL